ncbi:MAG: septum formation initiator family protein [Nitrospirae bacterium]|nr:MAG: septum formation initiator family protein [Nitrospirota bacterium]
MTRRNRSHNTLHRHQLTLRRAPWLVGGVMAALVAASFFGEMSIPKYLEMRKNAQALELEIQAMAKANAELRTDISRLQSDPARIEEVARERLGFVRKGETVYQVVDEPVKIGQVEPTK